MTPRLSWDAGSDLDPADVPAVLRYEVQVADSNTFPMSGTYYLFLGPTSNGQTYADIPAGTPLGKVGSSLS